MSSASGESIKHVPDYFGLFAHELEDLIAGDEVDDLLPFESPLNNNYNNNNNNQESGASGGDVVGLKNPEFFFKDGLGAGLSDYKKERLKGLMKRTVSVLTQEVDQMVDVVLRTCQLRDQLKSRDTPSSSRRSAASSDDEFVRRGKRPETSASPSERTVDEGIPDDNESPEEDFIGRPKKFKSMKELLSREDDSCANCGTLKTSSWRTTPNDVKICNDCGLKLRNGVMELWPEKKIKQGVAGSPVKVAKVLSSQNEDSCANCSATETSMWRRNPEGARICNACGLRARKEKLSLEKKKKQVHAGSAVEVDNKDEEGLDDLNFFLDTHRTEVEQSMKKCTDDTSATLSHMEQQLEGLLDTVMSKCSRNMTFFEKQRLCNMIKELPPRNFDRVVEIIKRDRGLDQHDNDNILVDLEDMDNSVLWRLYYYAKAFDNARKLLV